MELLMRCGAEGGRNLKAGSASNFTNKSWVGIREFNEIYLYLIYQILSLTLYKIDTNKKKNK